MWYLEEELKWHEPKSQQQQRFGDTIEAKGLCHVLADYILLGPT